MSLSIDISHPDAALSIYEAARLSLSFPIVKEGDPRWGYEALSEADHAARAAIRKRFLEKP